MSDQNKPQKNEETAVAERNPTYGERFVAKVENEFNGAVGHGVEFTDSEKQLANNLFVKIDSALKQHEADRVKRNQDHKTPFEWSNINMQKLATDAVHLVRLGLDASIKNHVHVIPYHNGKTGMYDLDLQVGYAGKDYYRKRMAVETVRNIRYELVHENDHFKVIKSDSKTEKDHYEFEIPEPFNRGDIKGGFGYIEYEDATKNQLVVVTEEEFRKVKGKAQTSKIWNEWPEKMRMKTLVHRVTDELTMDPNKINPSYKYIEDKENPFGDPAKEIPHQPAAEDRKDLDFGSDSNGQPKEAEDIDFKEQSRPEQSSEETDNGQERDEVLAEVNTLGKDIFGGLREWVKESRAMAANFDEEADNLNDLDLEGLRHIKTQLEHKAEAEA